MVGQADLAAVVGTSNKMPPIVVGPVGKGTEVPPTGLLQSYKRKGWRFERVTPADIMPDIWAELKWMKTEL